MALSSMILGIISIPALCLLGLGSLVGLVALILGIIALVRINRNPLLRGGKGFAIAGIVTGSLGFVGIVPMAGVLLPSLGRARELSNRSVCAANLRGIMQSICVYAADNGEKFPMVAARGAADAVAGMGGGVADSDVDTVFKSMYASSRPSVSQNLWILVLNGQVAPKQFICKSDTSLTVNAQATDARGLYFPNFNDGADTANGLYALSYGFAYPWRQDNGEVGGWWRSDYDAGRALIADMGSVGGVAPNNATPSQPELRTANSFNHQRDGQIVAYADAHSEFVRRPDVGHGSDNIYTGGGGTPDQAGRPYTGIGIPEIGNGGTVGAYDVCLVPVSDASSGFQRK